MKTMESSKLLLALLLALLTISAAATLATNNNQDRDHNHHIGGGRPSSSPALAAAADRTIEDNDDEPSPSSSGSTSPAGGGDKDKPLDELLAAMPQLSAGLKQTARFECELPESLQPASSHLLWLRLNRSSADIQVLSHNQRLIAPDRRLKVARQSPRRWQLSLDEVAHEDGGAYFLCQASCLNGGQTCEAGTTVSRPRFAGGARLNVLAPPRIVERETSASRVRAEEWAPLELSCAVSGEPPSQLTWKREDGRPLERIGAELRLARKPPVDSARLLFASFTRHQAGAYLCIASNGVQPGVSQRVQVEAARCRPQADAQQEEPCEEAPAVTPSTFTSASTSTQATPRRAWRTRGPADNSDQQQQQQQQRPRGGGASGGQEEGGKRRQRPTSSSSSRVGGARISIEGANQHKSPQQQQQPASAVSISRQRGQSASGARCWSQLRRQPAALIWALATLLAALVGH